MNNNILDILFCRQSLNYRRFNHDRDSGNNNFFNSFLHGVYRMTGGRHTPTPPGIESYDNIRTSARAMTHPPSSGGRRLFFQLVNISTVKLAELLNAVNRSEFQE